MSSHLLSIMRIAVAMTTLTGLVSASTATADSPDLRPSTISGDVCVALSGRSVGGVGSVSAVQVGEGSDTPRYCKLDGTIAPLLNVEIRLPEHWNGKLYYQGGGGFNGSIPAADPLSNHALEKGYVVVASDSGHQASVVDAHFALDPYSAQLWGSLSVPTVMSAAIKIVQSVYGVAPTRSYFEGCSNGGREGLMSAQRYPNLFDGIITRAPAFNTVGFFGGWLRTARLQSGGGQLTDSNLGTLASAVRGACDALDGLKDGIVSNLRACAAKFEVTTLQCRAGTRKDGCLSEAQLATVRSWLEPASFGSSPSYQYYGAYLTGNEDDPRNWPLWISGKGDFRKGMQFLLADSYARYFLARDPDQDSLQYVPYDRNPEALFFAGTVGDATRADLSSFRDAGGKLIIWQGGSDAAFSPRSTWTYYQELVAASGGPVRADGFVRAYEAPGVSHCSGGVGADTSDLLEALDRWVAAGQAPGDLTAEKIAEDGKISFKRPLCAFPKYPHYVGGDTRHRESFECRLPAGNADLH